MCRQAWLIRETKSSLNTSTSLLKLFPRIRLPQNGAVSLSHRGIIFFLLFIRRGGVGLSELPINIALIKLPSPQNENQRNQKAKQSDRCNNHKRELKTSHPITIQLLPCFPDPPRRRQLLLRLPVVQIPGHIHVHDIEPDRAGDGAEIVKRGVILEAEDLGDDGEKQWPLRAVAEADDYGGDVEGAGGGEGDEEVAEAGEEEDGGEEEGTGEFVVDEKVLGDEAGESAAEVIPDADEGDEGADGFFGVV